MERCRCCMQYFLITITPIYEIFITIISLYLIDPQDITKILINKTLYNPLKVPLVAGIIAMSIAIFGIIVALRESKCMLKIYAKIAMLLSVIAIYVIIVKYQSKSELMKKFEEKIGINNTNKRLNKIQSTYIHVFMTSMILFIDNILLDC